MQDPGSDSGATGVGRRTEKDGYDTMSNATCSVVEGGARCDRKVSGRGMCNMHWQRWRNNGDPLICRRPRQAPVCTNDDCDKPSYHKSLCLKHYREQQDAGREPCSVDSCTEPWKAAGLCAKHYLRKLRTGSTDDPKAAGRCCAIDGCSDHARARDMCSRHYTNWRKWGTPEAPPRKVKVIGPCIQDDCAKLGRRRNGMCDRHYRDDLAAGKPPCSIVGCESLSVREGFCKPHGGWSRAIFNLYGITAGQYDALLAKQGGCCAICRRPPDPSSRMKRLVVDHDHQCCPKNPACGKCVRGLLCQWCNRLLGLAVDDPGRLAAAIAYLYDTGTVQRPASRPKRRPRPATAQEQLALPAA